MEVRKMALAVVASAVLSATMVAGALWVTGDAHGAGAPTAACKSFSFTKSEKVAGWMRAQQGAGRNRFVAYGDFCCAW